MRGKELLTPVQREELLHISVETEHELTLHYTFSTEDLEIINQHRRDHNRLGFDVQLCILRYPGCTVTNMPAIPEGLLKFVAKQIGIDYMVYEAYAKREPTRREHLGVPSHAHQVNILQYPQNEFLSIDSYLCKFGSF